MSAKEPEKTPVLEDSAAQPVRRRYNPGAEAAASALHLYNSQEYRLEDLEAFMEEDKEKPED